jgi:hypothetical protein
MDRQIIVFVRDKHGRPLPGATILMEVDGNPRGGVKDSEGRASLTVPGPATARVRLTARFPGEAEQTVNLSEDQHDWTFTFGKVTGAYSNMTRQIIAAAVSLLVVLVVVGIIVYLGQIAGILPLVVGILLLLIALALAFVFKEPTLLQSHLIRSTFALGTGGVASAIPGWIEANVSLGEKTAIAAGGALAVFVVSYFFVPARDK